MSRVITGSFVGALIVITWREINNPDPNAPLPIPLPSRYVGAAVAFGVLTLAADIFDNEKIPDVIAVGLLIALGVSTAVNGVKKNAGTKKPNPPSGNAPSGPDQPDQNGAIPVNPTPPAGGNPSIPWWQNIINGLTAPFGL